jgi:hypothetical protein
MCDLRRCKNNELRHDNFLREPLVASPFRDRTRSDVARDLSADPRLTPLVVANFLGWFGYVQIHIGSIGIPNHGNHDFRSVLEVAA